MEKLKTAGAILLLAVIVVLFLQVTVFPTTQRLQGEIVFRPALVGQTTVEVSGRSFTMDSRFVEIRTDVTQGEEWLLVHKTFLGPISLDVHLKKLR